VIFQIQYVLVLHAIRLTPTIDLLNLAMSTSRVKRGEILKQAHVQIGWRELDVLVQ
jgi:hypothetical protein